MCFQLNPSFFKTVQKFPSMLMLWSNKYWGREERKVEKRVRERRDYERIAGERGKRL